MDSSEERQSFRWMYLAFFALLVLVVVVALPHVLEGKVAANELAALHDKAGFLPGMAPRDLGPVDASRAILMVHGFSGSPTNYHDLPEVLARDGWRVRVMTLPGHGRSPHAFQKTTGDEMLAGVLEELRALKATYKTVVLTGHSLGGALVTLAAAREPVDALILYAPFFGLEIDEHSPISVRSMVSAIATVLPWVPHNDDSQPVAFVPNRKFIRSYDWVPAQAGLFAMDVGRQVYTEDAISKITCPVLLIHSRGDKVNAAAASERAFERFSGTPKRAVWLHLSDHVIFWDYERLETIHATRVFLDQLFAPKP